MEQLLYLNKNFPMPRSEKQREKWSRSRPVAERDGLTGKYGETDVVKEEGKGIHDHAVN